MMKVATGKCYSDMYTYAFLLPPAHPLQLPVGIEHPIQLVGTAQLVAAIEPELTEARINEIQNNDQLLMQAILNHDRVLRELFQQATILPLRFGTRFASLQSILTHLEATEATYLAILNQFHGKAEYALKCLPIELPDSSLSPDLKGKEYFLAKKQQYQAQVEYQNRQREELNQLLHQIAQTYPRFASNKNQSSGETIYLLVDRDQAETLTQQVQNWQQQFEFWTIHLSDGLPPYHFLEG